MTIQIVLYQPDIPQNTGSFVRLCACLGLPLHIIEPCGFVLDEKRMQRVAMDYAEFVSIHRHTSWQAFLAFKQAIPASRLILLTTKASVRYTDVAYGSDDFLLLGRESGGVPQAVVDACDSAVTIPMQAGARSLNVVSAASMVVGEALRQTKWI